MTNPDHIAEVRSFSQIDIGACSTKSDRSNLLVLDLSISFC